MTTLPRFYVLERSTVEPNAMFTIRHVYLVHGGKLYSETKVWKEAADRAPKLVVDQARQMVAAVSPVEAETLDRLFQNCGYTPVTGDPGQLVIPS